MTWLCSATSLDSLLVSPLGAFCVTSELIASILERSVILYRKSGTCGCEVTTRGVFGEGAERWCVLWRGSACCGGMLLM